MTGTLPVEEVGSSLFSNKPLKSRSKFNLLQFVKGGSSSPQSTSHAQTAPGSSVSASWPLPLDEQPLSSLTSAGSTISGAASGLNLQTQYAASGSGHSFLPREGVVATLLSLAFLASPSVIGFLGGGQMQLCSSISRSLYTIRKFGSRCIFSGGRSYSGLSEGAPSPYTPGSLMSNKLDALPLGVSSQTQVAGLPIEQFHRLVLCLKWALLVSLHLGEATITVDCFHSLKLPLVNMLLATPSPFPHPKALPVSLPVSCVPVSNMPLPPRAALELSLGPLLVLPRRE